MEKTMYPLIFVHGMFGWGENEGINKKLPYWGATNGSLTDYLTEEGIECYAASVGPMSSAWDQACELYAQLTGTKVDYGAAHSERFGHARYGRTYNKPLFEGWNENKKVHLIGHSFGGNAIRMLTHLLTNGSEEERNASGEDTSPLFEGGKSELVYSVTTICSPLNGTTAYETAKKIKLVKPLVLAACSYAGILGRSRLNGKLVDFHLEQFGLTDAPDQKARGPLLEKIKIAVNSNDIIAYDMSPEGAGELNKLIKLAPDVFYYSYPFNAVRPSKINNIALPLDADFFFLKFTSVLMIGNATYEHSKTKTEHEVENDGLVDVTSATHPATDEYKSYDGCAHRGIWNVMPVHKGDHGTPIGLFADKEQTRNFYQSIIAELKSIEAQAPVIA